MKKINILIGLVFFVIIENKSQTAAPYTYDPKSGNYIITSGEDTLIFYPQTKIVPSINAWVVLTNDTFEYTYRITNGNSSEDHLAEFYLPNNQTIYDIKKPDDDWRFYYSKKTKGLYWSNVKVNHYTPPGEDYYEIGMPPGTSVDGFVYNSTGLPSIIDCHFQSSRLSGSDHEISGDIVKAMSILRAFPLNYVKRITIGPVLPPEPFVPSAFLDTLLSYTRQSVTLSWLKPGRDNDCDGDEKPQDGVSKNLEKRLEKVRTELTKGNTLKASKELEKFIKKVERISKRTEVMTSEAYALLKYNAEFLASRIITLPARPTGTLLQQIEELKAELTRQSSKKNIGGVLLVKSLTFLADQGKKQLQKPLPSTTDSAAAVVSIAAFQLFVDEIWELTGVASGKGKKFLALYVYDEAYIQLHYRAKYILEALPAPRTLIDMKSVQMDDDVRKELDAMQKMSKEQ